jgi:TolB-like protein
MTSSRGIALIQDRQYPFSAVRADATEFAFGPFRLEADGTLLRGAAPIHLPPKELAALRLLLENSGRIVTPQQLREALWGQVHVTADSIPKCLSSLRALLGPEEYIQTVYKQGYKFSAGLLPREDVLEASPLPRLAIFPFSVEFGVPEHLGAHTAEEAMLRLARQQPPMVTILARDSVFTLARRGLSALEAGHMLKADLALTGTIRALPAHYRFRAELIRVSDGAQIWVEDMLVERRRADGLETELARLLLFRLRASLSDNARFAWTAMAVADDAPKNISSPHRREAYEIYQHAHYEWQTLQRHCMQDGLQHLQRATELDPLLYDAHIDMIRLCIAQEFYGFMSPSVVTEIVQRAASQIPDLESNAERILPLLGWIEFQVHHDLRAAARLFELSEHLPHETWITRARLVFALSRRRFDEALELIDAAIQQDPFAPALRAFRAWTLHLKGDAQASVEQMHDALKNFPERESLPLYAAMIFAYNGQTEEAIRYARELTHRLPYFDPATATYAYTLACAGQSEEARQVLERLQWLSRERFVISSFTPAAWLALGDRQAAMDALRAAEQARCPWFFSMLADPRLASLQNHPDFLQMQQLTDNIATETVYC